MLTSRRGVCLDPAADTTRVSYAPPVSGAELRSALVGVTLGRPVNAAVGAFFFRAIFLLFFSGFIGYFWFFVSFSFFVLFLS
jgi:hypothetical protein